MTDPTALRFDEHGRASLDGVWDFFPGDHQRADLEAIEPEPIRVPGLWEAQGHLDLDGVAWYRRRFELDDTAGCWTLRFDAVMDVAEVFLNGTPLGEHAQPFTPFELDPTAALGTGTNELLVRVFDPPVDDPAHIRMAHGKQGWANHVFPSRPSLYMTYGGIWQPVTLRRHGPVVLRDVFVNGDPDDLAVTVEVANRSDVPITAQLGIRVVGRVDERTVDVGPRQTTVVDARFGPTAARRWSPADPALHRAVVDVRVGGAVSDLTRTRFGLRAVTVDRERILLDGVPYRMKSALVQGFRADVLYAEGTTEQIRDEVRAAKAMGFNTLRLHIKAFEPAYLDVCDEEGMLLHCDLPVAEPIDHEGMGADTALARTCVEAITEQVRRDRNHPSVILWAAMNELTFDRIEARQWERYEAFARTLFRAVTDADPTRPVIENDWVEPDPDTVYESPVLTAHWYGRLHAEYLDKIERESRRWADTGRPFYITEYGDWGLPAMPLLADPPFWDTHETYAAALADTRWPATIGRFVLETQRYQGLSDRLQTEVFRRHDHIGGYCLTELTDVPHELNGLLDLDRGPKPLAVREMTRANQVVLPMLHLDTLVVVAGDEVHAPLHIANDGPELDHVTAEVRFGDTPASLSTIVRVGRLPAHRATASETITVTAPDVPGSHDLVVQVRDGATVVAQNRYPVHVVARPAAPFAVRPLGDEDTAAALAAVGAFVGDHGVTVVGEGALADHADDVTAALADGRAVIVLAQPADAAPHFPVPVRLHAVATVWGSTVFHFTTDEGVMPSLPRRNVLVAEDSTVHAETVVTAIDGAPFPDRPVVIAYKPVPGALTGTVVGEQRVGSGRLILCQYNLSTRAAAGDAAARAILADLVRWASAPKPVLRCERRGPLAVYREET